MSAQNQQLIQQEVSRYRSTLERWHLAVIRSERDEDAFRMASQKPARGGMVASLGALVEPYRISAEEAVESDLRRRFEALDDTRLEQLKGLLRQCLAGNFPTLYEEFDRRVRDVA